MTKVWVIDSEGDGLVPTKLHCLGVSDPSTDSVHVTSSYDNMRKVLSEADILICHNLVRFDKPVFERLLGIEIKAKLIDTLALSWYLYPQRLKHGLESWGEFFGVPKPEINDWVNLSQEEYEHRVEEDVKINVLLWRKMWRHLIDLYGSKEDIWRLLDYLEFKMYCAYLQEKSKWKVDIEYIKSSLEELRELQNEKLKILTECMPKVPKVKVKTKPKRFLNKEGNYTKLGLEWNSLLLKNNLPLSYEGEVEIIDGYEDGNPNSPEQVKNWLHSFEWKPETFSFVKDKTTGDTRSIPQINTKEKTICPSIKKLYDKEPNLEHLEGLSVIQHRIGILEGFLSSEEGGYVKARIKGFTNTLRMKHEEVVNLPKPDKLHAAAIRGALICEEDEELCGSDLSSLEDRLKKHFIFPFDPEYVRSMDQEDWDPHLEIARLAGMITAEQIEEHKKGIKSHKRIRDSGKTANYSAQYGAGPPKIALSCNISIDAARKLHKAYWEMNWSVKKVASIQKIKTVEDQMWLYNPISKLWYSLRFEKDIFSTLVQGTGSYIFDMWLKKILDVRPQLTFQFHDEFGFPIKLGYREPCSKLIRDSLNELNNELNLHVKLDCDIQYGRRYSDIH